MKLLLLLTVALLVAFAFTVFLHMKGDGAKRATERAANFLFGAFFRWAFAPFPGAAMGSFGSMLQQNFPSLDTFRQYIATQNLGSQWEIIKQSLYDTIIYPAAGTVALNFFQSPIGGANSAQPGNATNPKTLRDTNMTQAGILPSPQMFFCSSMEVDFQPGSSAVANTFALQTAGSSAAAPAAATGIVQIGAANDVNTFYSTGSLLFNIGQKNYLQESPLLRFPPKCRFELDAAVGGNSATTANFGAIKMKSGGRPYQLDPGISLYSMQNFAVQLAWDSVQATPSTFNGQARVIIDGWLFRAVQ